MPCTACTFKLVHSLTVVDLLNCQRVCVTSVVLQLLQGTGVIQSHNSSMSTNNSVNSITVGVVDDRRKENLI